MMCGFKRQGQRHGGRGSIHRSQQFERLTMSASDAGLISKVTGIVLVDGRGRRADRAAVAELPLGRSPLWPATPTSDASQCICDRGIALETPRPAGSLPSSRYRASAQLGLAHCMRSTSALRTSARKLAAVFWDSGWFFALGPSLAIPAAYARPRRESRLPDRQQVRHDRSCYSSSSTA